MSIPRIQQPAPQFTSVAVFPDKEFRNLSLSDYLGKWVVFFWYPLDFTFVCPTEIIAFNDRAGEFAAINAQVIAASCDSEHTHLAWILTPRANGGLGDTQIPIVADFSKEVANTYGVLLPGGIPLRALFIISPTGVLRQITFNDLPVGRNVDEILRLVKAFQFTDAHGEVCPANWQPGDKTMVDNPVKSKAYFQDVFGGSAVASTSGSITNIGDNASLTKATKEAGTTVVYYWAPWCRNCKKVAPVYEKLAAETPAFKFVKVDTSVEGISVPGVDVLPTFHFFKNGNQVGSFVGSDTAALTAAIKKL